MTDKHPLQRAPAAGGGPFDQKSFSDNASQTIHPSVGLATPSPFAVAPRGFAQLPTQTQFPPVGFADKKRVPPVGSGGATPVYTAAHPPPARAVTLSDDGGDNDCRVVFDLTKDDSPSTGVVDLTSPQENIRRSDRDKKSTLVYINGQPVLAQNNYMLKGLTYQYGTDHQTAPPVRKRKATASKTKKPRAPRAPSSIELKRHAYNNQVKKRIEDKKDMRLQYLASNLDKLQPFLEDSVGARLSRVQVKSRAEPPPIYSQPDAIRAEMRDYQLQGLNWMVSMYKKNLGMILGDEMGLGKTLQTISLICYLKEREGVTGPSLVICPLSVLYSWCNELQKWAPSLNFLRLHSSSLEERESQRRNFVERATEYDVVVTTYEMAKAQGMTSLWARQHFNLLVLDEGHRIKDANSQIHQATRLIKAEVSLILTGTPLQNNLVELWALLSFLYRDIFIAPTKFAEAFDLTLNLVDKDKLLAAHELLDLVMIRRLKSEVEKLMPKKVETKVLCPLSNTQVFWYKALLMKDIQLLARHNDPDDKSKGTKPQFLNNLMMQLRKCCVHPFLFDGAEGEIDKTTMKDLISASGKLSVLDMLLRSLHKKGHRVVLFSQFTRVLDILDDYCAMRGWKYCRFDGATPRAQRNFIVNQFNAPGSDYFLFLMSTRSGGMGLNLQTADTCILFDSDWNPQPDIQAAARVHRIGQKKTVHVYRLICGGTVEERIVERAEKKLFLDQMVNQDSAAGEISLSKRELMSTLKFGCDAVFGADSVDKNRLPMDQDIDLITDRNRSENVSVGGIKGDATNTAADFAAEKVTFSTTKLGGTDFKQIRDEHKKNKTAGIHKSVADIACQWVNLQKRQRKSRIVNIEAENSGYGLKSVPVLAANNYDLENGESSVFQRELGGRGGNFGEVKKNVKRSGVDFSEQDFCQVCGQGGNLLCCPRCPVCVHPECVGVKKASKFQSCPHHRCYECGKDIQGAGGLLFPCQSCPRSYCEDCLPTQEPGFRILGTCDRMSKLGFFSQNFAYIHCSGICEEWAKQELNWSLPPTERHRITPEALDLSESFGKVIDATIEEEPRSRKRKCASMFDKRPSLLQDSTNVASSSAEPGPMQDSTIVSPSVVKPFPAQASSKFSSSSVKPGPTQS